MALLKYIPFLIRGHGIELMKKKQLKIFLLKETD